MRSSKYKHLAPKKGCKHYANVKKENSKKKFFSRAGSIFVAVIVVFSAIIIPSTTLIQNVEAVTSVKNAVFSIGGSDVYSDVIVKSCIKKEEKIDKPEKKETVKKSSPKKKTKKHTEKPKQTEKTTEIVTTQETTTAETTSAETKSVKTSVKSTAISVPKNYGLISTTKADTSYKPVHLTLSDSDRDKLERLVMGEAGSLGYTGCALVAQAIRDGMVLSKTTSVDDIISLYQYSASMKKKPNSKVKRAVSFIFDDDGYAVQHRILYFYASDMVKNPWHESQNFIVSFGNVRFFDKW